VIWEYKITYAIKFTNIVKMLSEIDKKILNRVYSSMGSKYIPSPIRWENGNLSHNFKFGRKHIGTIALLLICEFILRLKRLLFTISEQEISGSIIQSIYTLQPVIHLIFRFNIWVFKTDFVRLINQTLAVDAIWSK